MQFKIPSVLGKAFFSVTRWNLFINFKAALTIELILCNKKVNLIFSIIFEFLTFFFFQERAVWRRIQLA